MTPTPMAEVASTGESSGGALVLVLNCVFCVSLQSDYSLIQMKISERALRHLLITLLAFCGGIQTVGRS